MSADTPDLLDLPLFSAWGNDEWRKRAACKGADITIFFPEKGRMSVVNAGRSKIYCMQCPVRFECLKFAVDNYITVGTYGGLSPSDRRGLTSETVSERHAKFSLAKAHATLVRAQDDAPVETLARIVCESPEWVKEQLKHGGDFFF